MHTQPGMHTLPSPAPRRPLALLSVSAPTVPANQPTNDSLCSSALPQPTASSPFLGGPWMLLSACTVPSVPAPLSLGVYGQTRQVCARAGCPSPSPRITTQACGLLPHTARTPGCPLAFPFLPPPPASAHPRMRDRFLLTPPCLPPLSLPSSLPPEPNSRQRAQRGNPIRPLAPPPPPRRMHASFV